MGIYGKLEQKALKRFKEAEDAYREWLHKPVHIGSGLIEQINKRGLNKAPLFLYSYFVTTNILFENGEKIIFKIFCVGVETRNFYFMNVETRNTPGTRPLPDRKRKPPPPKLYQSKSSHKSRNKHQTYHDYGTEKELRGSHCLSGICQVRG